MIKGQEQEIMELALDVMKEICRKFLNM